MEDKEFESYRRRLLAFKAGHNVLSRDDIKPNAKYHSPKSVFTWIKYSAKVLLEKGHARLTAHEALKLHRDIKEDFVMCWTEVKETEYKDDWMARVMFNTLVLILRQDAQIREHLMDSFILTITR